MDENGVIKVEGSTELAKNTKTMEVSGLEEIPTSMIPVPFYKLVQPGSTNVSLADGKDALTGTFLMSDLGESTEQLRFLILRAKRQVREFQDDYGNSKKALTIGILGLNLDRMSPFILNVSVASFSAFGQLMAQVKERKMKHAWDFPVTATTEKVETEKQTERGVQKVKFWVINFALGKEALTKEEKTAAEGAYLEFAASLDGFQQTVVEKTPAEDYLEKEPTF